MPLKAPSSRRSADALQDRLRAAPSGPNRVVGSPVGSKRLAHDHGKRCVTESRFPGPQNVSDHRIQPEVVVDVSRGKVPLWTAGTTLHWRFDERSLRRGGNIEATRRRVRALLRDAIAAWGTAAPVAFQERKRGWDFEIAVLARSDCGIDGCTLASAFFPSSQRQRLLIYPTMFEYDRAEQVSTLVHELGHVFGLRHFFAVTEEKEFPSLIFGEHSSYTVMNYGPKGRLTAADKRDLRRLYKAAWSPDATARIGRQVRLVHAPHMGRGTEEDET